MKIQSRLSEIRQMRGAGAAELAKTVGVTRQTIYAIESGAYVPNTAVALRLARALEVRVEELFSLDDGAPAPVITEDVEMVPGGPPVEPGFPVQLCKVEKRTMGVNPSPAAWHLPVADAVVMSAGGRGADARKARVQLFGAEVESGQRLLMAGCDPAMSVLARHVRKGNVELVLAHRNSSQSLVLLRENFVHVAGSHLRDEATGESNLPHVRKLFPRGTVAVITFAMWEEGIVVAKRNPKSIREIADLARKGVTLVNREAGSGSRMLLDASLKRLGIPAAKVAGYDKVAYGHLPAAWQVRVGDADACIATKAAARVFALDFVPLISERYDLVIRKPYMALPAVQVMLDTLSRTAFRRELEGLGGYTTTEAGRQVA